MDKFSTHSFQKVSEETIGRQDVTPRQRTLDFIRNYARACSSLGLDKAHASLGAVVLN